MRSTFYKECNCEKFFFLPSRFFSLYFTVGPRSQIIKLVETVLASLTFPLLPQLPSSPGSSPRPCPPLPHLPSRPPPPPHSPSFLMVSTLHPQFTLWDLKEARGSVPRGHRVVWDRWKCWKRYSYRFHILLSTIYCIFFFFYFFCNSFAIIYQKVQKFDITISVCIIYLWCFCHCLLYIWDYKLCKC